MFENRNRKVDMVALALLAATVFLGVSLFTYSPADPPSTLIYPATTEVENACGLAGAIAAHYLFESIGALAWYALGSLAVVTVLLGLRVDIDQPLVRAGGWCLTVVALAALFAMSLPNWTPGPLVGAGGYVGALGRSWLETRFATAGAYIFTLCVLAAGLLLSTDYWLLRFAAATGAITGTGLAKAGRMASVTRVKTDLEDEFVDELEDEEGEEEEYEEEYEYEEEEDEEASDDGGLTVKTPTSKGEDEHDEAQTPAKTSLRDRLTSALGLGKGEQAKAAEAEEDAEVESEEAVSNVEPLPVKPKKKSEREQIIEQLELADQTAEPSVDYQLPPLDLLLPAEDICYEEHKREVREKAKVLEKTFQSFGLNIKVKEVETGPVIAQYEVELESGLRLSKVTSLADDLAIALRVPSVRIVAPIPGKNTVGIEVPNSQRQLVRLREVIEETNGQAQRMKIPIYLGQDVAGNPMAVDLAALPHLLIAGRTGTGKSVCLNSIIVSILMSRGPDEVRMLMIDPKMVELSGYRKLPHLMHPVVTDMKKAEAILAWAVDKMEERYQLLARAGVRHVSVYNQLGDEELRERVQPASEAEWEDIPKQLPFIVIVADEMADLMMTAGKDVEQHIIRLAQKSRAVGIHLILATQKPTVDVITGLIKSNLPARIAFQVASRTDSRVVLDENGADKLLGNGDMLFLSPGTSMLLRGQGTYLSDDEITHVVDFVGTDEPQFAGELMQLKTKEEVESAAGSLKNRDELYEAAVEVVVREGRGSVSLLQRALGIGYGRAARLIDFMAEDRIVGEYAGSQAREVLITMSDWEAMRAGGGEEVSDAPTTQRKLQFAAEAEAESSSNNADNETLAPWEDEAADEVDEDAVEIEDEADEVEDDEYEEAYEDEADHTEEADAGEESDEYEEEAYEDTEEGDEEYEEEYEEDEAADDESSDADDDLWEEESAAEEREDSDDPDEYEVDGDDLEDEVDEEEYEYDYEDEEEPVA